MKEKLLCKCQNRIAADYVREVLNANGIASRCHDETDDQLIGAYGPVPGIAIYVLEEDYETARTIAEPVLNSQTAATKPFCPKCGSEDLEHLERSRSTTPLLILSIVLFIAPCIYLYYTMGSADKPAVMNYSAVIVLIISLILMIVGQRKNANFKCRHCGRKFHQYAA